MYIKGANEHEKCYGNTKKAPLSFKIHFVLCESEGK